MANIEFKHKINLCEKQIDTLEKQVKLAGVIEKITHEEQIKVYKDIIKDLQAIQTYGGAQNLIRHASGQIKQADLFPVEAPQQHAKIQFQKQF